MKVIKRDGQLVDFQPEKIKKAIESCFKQVETKHLPFEVWELVFGEITQQEYDGKTEISVEEIQDLVENALMCLDEYKAAKEFILYRERHKEATFIRERIDYMDKYAASSDNASTASETDANANVTLKNVANLEGEVYKTTNRLIQRQRMKKKLQEMYPEVASQYIEDLNNHIIYVHDEASSPCLKFYCQADSLYPLMTEGCGNIDGVTPSAPDDLRSFTGQVTNLVFLLSAQCKGAVALSEYLVAFSYYAKKDFGDKWWERLDEIKVLPDKTIKHEIRKAMKHFIWGINQPAGNRSYNSPFSNISIYDHTYFDAMFHEFYFPDGTQAEWDAVNCLQRIFLELHRELRLIKPLTFPVTTFAMVNDGKDIIDKEYKELCAEEWAKGSSFFCYNSDNPTSLASCCRVLNEMTENTFNSINGLQGIMTGSCNVITLNLNRIVQDWYKTLPTEVHNNLGSELTKSIMKDTFKDYLGSILERVYKYQIAFKTMLYDVEDQGMFASSNAGYIKMSKLYSTIGLIGYCEAAEFLGMKINKNEEYLNFLKMIFGFVKEQNKLHAIRDPKRPFLFNSEAIPGESLAVKLYNWDKADGYWVPEDQNLYSSYFFKQWDPEISVLDKLYLHGKEIAKYSDGGQAAHIHLDSHLSKEQYLKLLDYSTANGVTYFTFNIPMSECKDCGHVVNAPIKECPVCNSKNIDYWVRIIGYLRPLSAYSKDRYIEAQKRIYSKKYDI